MKKSLLLFTFLCILLGSAEIHAYTPAAKKASPLLIQPAANSTLDLCPRVLGFYQVVFNANNPQARKLSYKLFLNDPRQLLQEHVVTFASSAEATQNASVVLSNNIKPKQQYLIELKTLDAKGNMIKQEYFTFFTSDKNSESPLPQLISPVDGATGVALKPTLQVKPFPATACGSGIESVYFAVDTYPADWQGSDMQSTTFTGGVYSWQVPNPLAPGTKYQVKVIFQAPGAVSSTNVLTSEYTFTTEGSQLPPLAVTLKVTLPGAHHPQIEAVAEQDPQGQRKILFYSRELDLYPADWKDEGYEIYNTTNTDQNLFTTVNTLKGDTKYEARVAYAISDNPSKIYYATTVFTTGPSPAPSLIYPAPNSTFNSCTDNNAFTANANGIEDLRKFELKVYRTSSHQLLGSLLVNPNGEPTTDVTNILRNSGAGEFTIELTSYGPSDMVLAQSSFTVSATGLGNRFPTFISPLDNATNVSLTPTVNIQPYTSCGNLKQVIYQIDRYPFNSTSHTEDYQTATFDSATYSWQVPNALKPNTKYEVTAWYITDYTWREPQLLESVTFTTGTETGVIRETKPVLVTPAPDAPLVYCDLVPFVGISVNPNNAKARKVYITGIGSMDCCPDNGISLTPQQAMGTVGASFRIGYPNGSYSAYQLGEVRMKELKITTVDSLGNVLAENTYMVPTTGPNRKAPDFMSPLAGATNVSLTPMIQMEEYLANSCEHMAFISYEIDTYPADWQGSDYIKANVVSSASQWQCPTSLLSNTKYEVRVNYAFTGIGALSSVSQVFTTGSSSARAATSLVSTVLQENESVASPNPFAKELAVKLHPGYEKATITVISQQGQRLFTQESTGGQTIRFNADGLHSGIYLIRITDGRGHEENLKVIKQ